jgi:hypothetical protein
LAPAGSRREPIAGDAGLIVNDRDVTTDEPIKERGFPDVRTSNDGDGANAFRGVFRIHLAF